MKIVNRQLNSVYSNTFMLGSTRCNEFTTELFEVGNEITLRYWDDICDIPNYGDSFVEVCIPEQFNMVMWAKVDELKPYLEAEGLQVYDQRTYDRANGYDGSAWYMIIPKDWSKVMTLKEFMAKR